MRRIGTHQGFTLIELMIVVVILGVLAAISIPNFISMTRRAQEGAVKANMHTLQLILEDFSILNDGNYPTNSGATTQDGRTLAQLCPGGNYPVNPLTKLPSVVQFNAPPTPGMPGELGINPANANYYLLRGNGPKGDSLRLALTTGQ